MKDWREQELMNQLRIKGKLELGEVVELLQVSESTARRLFSRLEEEGKIIRVYGGIQLSAKNPAEYSFERVAQNNIEEKRAIAAAAVGLLRDGDTIFCDSGTTVLCFCMEIVRRIHERPLNIQVFTNSLAILEVLSPYLPVVMLGGEYRPHRKDFSGYLAELAISRIHTDRCFIGTDGYDGKKYLTTTDFDTARLAEIAISNSDMTVILCDSSKFAECEPIGYAEIGCVDLLVTDSGLDSVIREQLEGFPSRLMCVDMEKWRKENP